MPTILFLKNKVVIFFLLCYVWSLLHSGCAIIVPPSGGPKDSLPPNFVTATPPNYALNIKTEKPRFQLRFDEYIQVKDVSSNLVVAPLMQSTPSIDYKLTDVFIRIKDTLDENTTYSFNFGDGIVDVNEGNINKNFTYVFSTGNALDSNVFSGKVIVAEIGKPDSTLIVVLHKNLSDTAVLKNKPNYYAKVDGRGNFSFRFLPDKTFAAYVISTSSYTKTYNDSTLMFAFLDSTITVSQQTPPVIFYAYQQVKPPAKTDKKNNVSVEKKKPADFFMTYKTTLDNQKQDILDTYLKINYSQKLASFDSTKFVLCDTSYKPLPYAIMYDTITNQTVSIKYPWQLATLYNLIIANDAVCDSAEEGLMKGDTIHFSTMQEEDYGSVKFNFDSIDFSKHPVLQLVKNDAVVYSIAIKEKSYYQKYMRPGDYEIRILWDANQNRIWDPGNYKEKIQPEVVQGLTPNKLSLRAAWDNESNIRLREIGDNSDEQKNIR